MSLAICCTIVSRAFILVISLIAYGGVAECCNCEHRRHSVVSGCDDQARNLVVFDINFVYAKSNLSYKQNSKTEKTGRLKVTYTMDARGLTVEAGP